MNLRSNKLILCKIGNDITILVFVDILIKSLLIDYRQNYSTQTQCQANNSVLCVITLLNYGILKSSTN